MTDSERESFKAFIKQYTAENTKSKKAAQKVLIEEGIYTSGGALRPEYGGKSVEAKAA
jgi:hypothetical protein